MEFPDGRIKLHDAEKQTVNNAVKYADYALGRFIAERAPVHHLAHVAHAIDDAVPVVAALATLAIAVGEQPETVEDVYEPFLIQQALLARTPRGGVAMDAAWQHLNNP